MKEMLTVEKIFSRGNAVLINFSEEIGYAKSTTATVISLEKDGVFLAIDNIDVLSKIHLDAEITIGYQTSTGVEYLFRTYVIKKIVKESPILIVAQPKDVSFISLRRFRRTDVKLPFYIYLDGNKINGEITNLSPCGLLANFNEKLTIINGQEIHFEINFPTNSEPIHLHGEIVRYEVDKNTTILAINFLEINEENRKIIIDFTLHI